MFRDYENRKLAMDIEKPVCVVPTKVELEMDYSGGSDVPDLKGVPATYNFVTRLDLAKDTNSVTSEVVNGL